MIEFAPRTEATFTYDQAWLYAATLTYNDHYDWRLPTEDEYSSHRSIRPNSWYDPDLRYWDSDYWDRTTKAANRYVVPVR